MNFTELYAIPGANSIIDGIDPITGLTCINGNTEAEMLAREPKAVRMTWDAWQTAASARQQTPITWDGCTAEHYDEMLNVLPPIDWNGGAFLVGEASDHDFATGRPRYSAYRRHGDVYEFSSRPLTRAEFRAELAKEVR